MNRGCRRFKRSADGAEDAAASGETSAESRCLSRRSLVAAGAGIAGMFAVGLAGRALAADDGNLLRPPGGQDAVRLQASCIKCDRCRSACPTGAIDVAHLEDGWINARTPVLNFRKGHCDFCADLEERACVRNCPTGAIAGPFDPFADKLGIAVVHEDECLLTRGGSGICSERCIEACAFDALSIDENGLVRVDERSCNGCGACEYVCPSSSYSSYAASGLRGITVEPLRR